MKVLFVSSILLLLFFSNCGESVSASKNLINGLAVKANRLEYLEAELSVGEKKTNNTNFIYGQEAILQFQNVEGFEKTDGKVFPGMNIFVVGSKNDTVFSTNDLYEEYTTKGINLDPLALRAMLVVAKPMKANQTYKMIVNIWDKKGSGTLRAQMPFKIIDDNRIKIESKNLNYSSVYLFSEQKGKVIVDGHISFNEKAILAIEGLTGLTEIEGKVFPGMKLIATDSKGNKVLDNADLFSEYSQTGVSTEALLERISADIFFTEGTVNNPIKCEVEVFDKKSDSKIIVKTEFELK
jgi:hypothetical protein